VVEVDEPRGPGNALVVEVAFEQVTGVFTGFGKKGRPAEDVALATCREVDAYLDHGAPVGRHLADQLLVPLAVAGGGRFRTTVPSSHTRTNAEVIRRFLGLSVELTELDGGTWEISVPDRR
ncbi:MAG: RNA 3'-terminal phosphate cyclase, partial [Gemmatimonadota bacterium]